MEIEELGPNQQNHLLSDQIKWNIVFYKELGYSNKETARMVGISYNRPTLSHQTVKSVWTKYHDNGDVENQWNEAGRPSIIEEEDTRRLKTYFKRNPKKSISEAKVTLGIPASRPTINRAVTDKGLKAYRAPVKILITAKNQERRLEFAEKWRKKGTNYWDRMIFSDESSFSLTSSNGRVFIRRIAGQDYEEEKIQHENQTQSLMVWGCISIDGVGPLVRIDQIEEGEETLNGARYLTLLQRYLLQNYPELKNQKLYFQQDNAPSHRYHEVLEWLNLKGVQKITWPAQSPDLNLIEAVWNEIKFRIRGEVFLTKDLLWKRLKKEWRLITIEFIEALYDSMPRRIEAVIDVNGGNTKY